VHYFNKESKIWNELKLKKNKFPNTEGA
jgi:hypothetical protein